MKKRLSFFMALMMVLTLFGGAYVSADPADNPAGDVVPDADDMTVVAEPAESPVVSYDEYVRQHKDEKAADAEVVIAGGSFAADHDAGVESVEWHGKSNVLHWESQEGSVEWKFHVDKAGLYQLKLEYEMIDYTDKNAELALSIDGALPFTEASKFSFSRIFRDIYDEDGRFNKDKNGNEMTAKYEEVFDWQTVPFTDFDGMHADPFLFALSEGDHTITLTIDREPLYIASLIFTAPDSIPEYDSIAPKNGEEAKTASHFIKKQAENAVRKAETVSRPVADYASPATEPYVPLEGRLNALGGDTWEYVGQWVEWEMEVPEDGWYKIGIKFKQSFVRGLFTSRSVMIDGEIPCEELQNIRFVYDSSWQINELGDEDGPFYFYLTKGTHTIRLEPTLHDLADILNSLSESQAALNKMYRRIIMITGVDPDPYQDYSLTRDVPNLLATFESNARILRTQVDALENVIGKTGSEAAVITQMAEQLEEYVKTPSKISKTLGKYKENLSALSAWILAKTEQPLALDYIYIATADKKAPAPEANFFEKIWHTVVQLYGSYIMDYSGIGDSNSEGITVWVTTARDQANIIKRLTEESFSQTHDTPVNVQLVTASLINAIMAGYAPDVALSQGDPVNLALRGAVAPLDGMDGFDEVRSWFSPQAFNGFTLDGHVYGIPETETYEMLFYRKDILDELELDINDIRTWDDLLYISPILQHNNMQIGISGEFYAQFYQNGGEYLRTTDEGRIEVNIDDDIGYQAFLKYISFYADYGFPLYKDEYNRFRTGEMPIMLTGFGMYNKLTVAAPEIAGLWEMKPCIGTLKEDGTIDNTFVSTGTCTIIPSASKHKDEAWEFVKWWDSAEVQAAYGNELEALLGTAARYATANMDAFKNLAWSKSEVETLNEQRMVNVRQEVIPGSYYIGRNLSNAFSAAYLRDQDPREMLKYWTSETNREIDRKCKEFGLYYYKDKKDK